MRISQAIDKIKDKIEKLKIISNNSSNSIASQKAIAAKKYIDELNQVIETLEYDEEKDTITIVSISGFATHPCHVEEKGTFYKLAYNSKESNFYLYMVPISTL